MTHIVLALGVKIKAVEEQMIAIDTKRQGEISKNKNKKAPENLQHSAGVTAELGYLVEETMYTTAFCLPKYTSTIGSTPLSQRVGTSAVAKDAPNSLFFFRRRRYVGCQ